MKIYKNIAKKIKDCINWKKIVLYLVFLNIFNKISKYCVKQVLI